MSLIESIEWIKNIDKMKAAKSKNEGKQSLSNIIKSKIDIKAGDMTFGQRIELGKIFSGNDSDIVKFEKVFFALHKHRPKFPEYKILAPYFQMIVDGLEHWLRTESVMLKYEPTPEEKRAGIADLSKKIGEMGTIKALAKAYSIDPDKILDWKYAKVFGILYTDLEEIKYQRNYNQEITKPK